MNTKNIFVMCATLLSIMGCTAKTDDLVAFTNQVRATVEVSIDPSPEFSAQPPFEYTAGDMRSPFVRPKSALQALVGATKANCLQPDFERSKEPLESYGIDAIAMAGLFNAANKRWALFKTNDGSLFKATVGNHLGLFHGKITAVSNNAVTITELLPDGAGCWQQKQTTLTMASLPGENDNV